MSYSETAYSANLSFRHDGNEHAIFTTGLGVQMYRDDQLGAEDLELCVRTLLRREQAILLASKEIEVRHLISSSRFDPQYLSKRFFMAGIEMHALEAILRQEFPDFPSFYRKRIRTPRGIKLLLLDKHERTMMLSYFINGNYFA